MKVLNINSSSNRNSSTSTLYAKKLIEQLKELYAGLQVKERHTTYSDIHFIDEDFLGAMFVKGDKSETQLEVLAVSNLLVEEVKEADVLVISSPIYNFSVPASLKAYFDLIARAGLTFQYTENGPVGLLKDKKAYVIISSGGTEIGSEIDYAGNYVKHFLGFLGITDVEFVKLDQLMFKNDEKIAQAEEQLTLLT